MKMLGMTIKLVIEVDDTMAEKFQKSPTGFLTLGGSPLGAEDLEVGVINEEAVEPIGMHINLKELGAAQKDAFLAE